MKNVIAGQAAATTAAPTLHLSTYRRAIMAVLSAECFTPAERVRANHSVYECEDAAKLALWLKNVRRVYSEREAAEEVGETTTRLPEYATTQQKEEITRLLANPCLTRPEKTRALLQLPRLDRTQAILLVGELWAKVLYRTKGTTDTPADTQLSFSSAA